MKLKPLLILCPLFISQAYAGGILLPEIATFDSVSSAGVANAVNRTDASSVITSPAGLSKIKDHSFSIGIQNVEAYSAHSGEINGHQLNSSGENGALAPSLAYAKRVNDEWVIAASLHAEGGLGMEYDNGQMGLNAYDSMSMELANVHFGSSYNVNERFSLGGAILVQHLMISINAFSNISNQSQYIELEGNSTKASFLLSAMYDLTDSTYFGINYKHKVDHSSKMDLKSSVANINDLASISTTWPSIFDLGISHDVNENINIKLRLGYEAWHQYGKTDGRPVEDIYSIGTSASYKLGTWTYQAGIKFDSEMVKNNEMLPDLALGKQVAIGLGAEKILSNSHRIGMAYEYRDLGTPTVNYDLTGDGINNYHGKITDNRIHFISLSYAY